MFKKLYPYRFEIFFFSQIAVLFGSLIVPSRLFEPVISPLLFQINLLAGVLLLHKKRKLMWFFISLLIISSIIVGSNIIESTNNVTLRYIRMITYFLFYVVVTYEIIKQVWEAILISKNVILGLISGYISLGLIGFFICINIEMIHPGSFQGLSQVSANINSVTESLMYFSYITLLSIGYGDIIPITAFAHKAAILIGLMGQIYIVVITAIVVGKYINQTHSSR